MMMIIIMGVSGSGKSTVGAILADALKRPLIEGDSLHPPANIEKMSKGIPLNDDDRLPWLKAIAARIDDARRAGQPVIVACSALKRSYRGILQDGHDDVGFVYLKGTKEQLAARMATRKGHFMPPQLLDSQLATLQEPGPDEPAIAIAIDATADDIVRMTVEKFGAR
ncbi:MAG: gluconokinase [Pseudolabrys sp.]|nr:gluconokinase [Pseudolabrys sp.]